MSKPIDLTGRRFGRLVVIGRGENSKKGEARWVCQCDCGNVKLIWGTSLRKGTTTSCGCFAKEKLLEARTKHHGNKTRLYRIWLNMKGRVNNQNHKVYKDYGGRGITICKEWENDFAAFCNWALESGYSDSLTIDRIDNDKGYSPTNCRWTDMKTQNNNRRYCHYLEFRGSKKTLSEWSEITGIREDTINRRLTMGWSIEKALTTPVRKKKRKQEDNR